MGRSFDMESFDGHTLNCFIQLDIVSILALNIVQAGCLDMPKSFPITSNGSFLRIFLSVIMTATFGSLLVRLLLRRDTIQAQSRGTPMYSKVLDVINANVLSRHCSTIRIISRNLKCCHFGM